MSLFNTPRMPPVGVAIPVAILASIVFRGVMASLPEWVNYAFIGTVTLALAGGWVVQTRPVRRLRRKVRLSRTEAAIAPVLKVLFAAWDREEILSAEAAAPGELEAFERHYGVRLPSDLRAYFLTVNGTKAGELGQDDGNGVGFWHFNQMRTFQEAHISGGPGADRLFAFAEYAVRFFTYGVRLGSDPTAPTPEVVSAPQGQVRAFYRATTRQLELPRPWKDDETDPRRAVRKRRSASY